jgi:hypothetical protein
VLLDPGMQGVPSALLRLLEPYPEARAAVAAALAAANESPAGEQPGGGLDSPPPSPR